MDWAQWKINGWRDKVHLEIAKLCWQSYKQANPKPGKKHVPYSAPAVAQLLVDALGRDDEEECKAIMLQYGRLPFDVKF